MDWPAVINFIRTRDAAFLDAVQGVPAAAIDVLAAEGGTALPSAYVMFLQHMGMDSNGLTPFGPTQDHGFTAIVERLDDNDEDSPSDRYFPVALETDESLEALFDRCIDLERSDGDDAPLMLLEQGVPLAWQQPVDTGETFGERITASVFNHFSLRARSAHDIVVAGGTAQAGEGRATLHRVLALLKHAGFAPVLPSSDHLVCLQGGMADVLARVDRVHELLTVRLGGDDSLAVKELADQLLAGVPGLRRPAGPRNLD